MFFLWHQRLYFSSSVCHRHGLPFCQSLCVRSSCECSSLLINHSSFRWQASITRKPLDPSGQSPCHGAICQKTNGYINDIFSLTESFSDILVIVWWLSRRNLWSGRGREDPRKQNIPNLRNWSPAMLESIQSSILPRPWICAGGLC